MNLANCNPPLWVRPSNSTDLVGSWIGHDPDRSLVDPPYGNYKSSRKRHSMPLVITAFVFVAILVPMLIRI